MWYIPKLTSEELAQHQFRRFALLTRSAAIALLKRWSTPQAYTEINKQFSLILETQMGNGRMLGMTEIPWVFMFEPLYINGEPVLLMRGTKVTENWVPAPPPIPDEPPALSSATFTVALELDKETGKIVDVSERFQPSTDFRFGIDMKIQEMFPDEPWQPKQPAGEETGG